MADLGSITTQVGPHWGLPVVRMLTVDTTFGWTPRPIYDQGVVSARIVVLGAVGEGGGTTVVYVDNPIYLQAPPAVDSAGDWGYRFFRDELAPVTINQANVEIKPTLYVVPQDSTAYIREMKFWNDSGATRTVRVWAADMLEVEETLTDGQRHSEQGLWILGVGEVLQAATDIAVAGMWCEIYGVLEVRF